MEETGREILWPEAIDRIFTSPLVGVGESHVNLEFTANRKVPPHNSFLHFALSSGVVPLFFWLAYWIQAGWKSLEDIDQTEVGPYRIPFLLFTFVQVMLTDLPFMLPWALLTVSVMSGSGLSYFKDRRRAIGKSRGRGIAHPFGRRRAGASLPAPRYRF